MNPIPVDDLFASRGNVLAEIAPPFRLHDGPDVLISVQRHSYLVGITALLQNPYDLRLPMTVEVLSSFLERLHDRLSFELPPLAIVQLSLPLAVTNKFKIRFASNDALSRSEYLAHLVRPLGGGGLDLMETAKLNAAGLAQALMGIGKVGFVQRGGSVGNPFTQEFEAPGQLDPGLNSSVAGRLETIWAPDDVPPIAVQHTSDDRRLLGTFVVVDEDMRNRAIEEAAAIAAAVERALGAARLDQQLLPAVARRVAEDPEFGVYYRDRPEAIRAWRVGELSDQDFGLLEWWRGAMIEAAEASLKQGTGR